MAYFFVEFILVRLPFLATGRGGQSRNSSASGDVSGVDGIVFFF